MKPFLITIARQYGSGGKTIGRMLAAELGIPCYDREIITLASEDSGINARLFSDERLKPDFWQRIRGGRPGTVVPPESAGFVSNDNLFEYQARIIRRLAESDLQPRLSFKIAGVDSLALSLERGGRIVTYNRVK